MDTHISRDVLRIRAAVVDAKKNIASFLNAVCDRLAAYEDTGLEPEEIMGLVTMDKRSRMAKMLRWEDAEQESLLIEPQKED